MRNKLQLQFSTWDFLRLTVKGFAVTKCNRRPCCLLANKRQRMLHEVMKQDWLVGGVTNNGKACRAKLTNFSTLCTVALSAVTRGPMAVPEEPINPEAVRTKKAERGARKACKDSPISYRESGQGQHDSRHCASINQQVSVILQQFLYGFPWNKNYYLVTILRIKTLSVVHTFFFFFSWN